jgi:hypothetical protein
MGMETGDGKKKRECTQRNSKDIILDCVCLHLVEGQQDECLVVVRARFREQGEEPVFQEGGGEVDGGVVGVVDLWAPGGIT